MNFSSLPFVSVIIPVFNDADRIKMCLEALDQQSYSTWSYEVIVVDNGSEDNIGDTVSQFRQTVLTRENNPGSYSARNKGISVAKGDIIAFTDSDCIPDFHWIENGVRNLLRKPNCGLLAGRIDLFFRDPGCLSSVEVYEKINGFNQKEKVEKYRYGLTANLFTRRSVLNRVGLFNAELKSGGDLDWGRRVLSCGYEQVYASDTLVSHPARYSFTQLYRKSVRVEGGLRESVGLRNLTRKSGYSIIDLARDVLRLIKSFLGLLCRFIVKKDPFDNLTGLIQKSQYIFVFVFVRIVKIFERIRLRLGGIPRR